MNPESLRAGLHKTLSRRPEAAKALRDHGIDVQRLAQIAMNSRAARVDEEGLPSQAIAYRENLPLSIVHVAESIIEVTHRQPLLVNGTDFDLPVDAELSSRLRSAQHLIGSRLLSVGRVEVFDGVMKYPVGTAWMVAHGIAITNRHVAEKFAQFDETGSPSLQKDLRGRAYKVAIDFKEEHGSPEELEVAVDRVLYLAKAGSQVADIALLSVVGESSLLPSPIPLLDSALPVGRWVAVVGYPQPDDRLPDEAREVEEAYFSNIYGVKRLSPGEIDPHVVADAPAWLLAHDATTLGGNSGSVLLDLETGAAAGIHFRGHYKKANYAVSSVEIRRILVSLGIESVTVRQATRATDFVADDGLEAAEDLSAFQGYDSGFIGDDAPAIPLPELTERAPGELATLRDGSHELRYRNFSVLMNKERRLCYFSAVNIDGRTAKAVKGQRPGWRLDRRLDAALQIKDECYGQETQGKFSRGHMTRREDPNWGTQDEAVVSNRHTFYVSNACPQMQPFNAGLWLSLEDYALENCKQDKMRISVFTGPVFGGHDPEYFGVLIPVTFWKVIAFIHDDTGELTATGYTMSQKDVLPTQDEFVFGQFQNRQVTIKSIEKLTGLSFGTLRDHDPFDDGTEALAFKTLRTHADVVLLRRNGPA